VRERVCYYPFNTIFFSVSTEGKNRLSAFAWRIDVNTWLITISSQFIHKSLGDIFTVVTNETTDDGFRHVQLVRYIIFKNKRPKLYYHAAYYYVCIPITKSLVIMIVKFHDFFLLLNEPMVICHFWYSCLVFWLNIMQVHYYTERRIIHSRRRIYECLFLNLVLISWQSQLILAYYTIYIIYHI